ncbi:hypothetical protein ACNQGP_01405 [Flavobacterium sp. GT2N3]|uniref:hypothetical protein n=1 Tax=unclassified Flavobacterium TaxID=196869 RepID=UPI003AACBBA7
MQKIDFIKNLEDLTSKLKSVEIVQHYKSGFASPNVDYNYNNIVPILFQSKSSYDNIRYDFRYKLILETLEAEKVYAESNLSSLTVILKNTTANNIIPYSNAISLFNFHNTLIQTLQLSKNLLDTTNLSEDLNKDMDNGIIIFQIVIEGEGLETEKYIKILSALNELIEIINKISDEEEKSEIVLLDSGSDTNIGVKTGIETAKSLFLIFKEVWDFIANYKFYKQAQKSNTLLESLSIRAEIMKKVEDGVITKEEATEYIHMIKTRTDDLIGMKVMPKQIVLQSNLVNNQKLLSEFEGIKMLSAGEN